MPELRPLSPSVSVGPQVRPEALDQLASEGFTSVINNRPDDEEAGQPSSAEIKAAAALAGLDYLHAPVSGMPNPDVVEAVAERLETAAAAGGRTAMFCRSGMRSAATWAMAVTRSGATSPAEARAAAADAGYDLSRLAL